MDPNTNLQDLATEEIEQRIAELQQELKKRMESQASPQAESQAEPEGTQSAASGSEEGDNTSDNNPVVCGLIVVKRKNGGYGFDTVGQMTVDEAIGLAEILKHYVSIFRDQALATAFRSQSANPQPNPSDSDEPSR